MIIFSRLHNWVVTDDLNGVKVYYLKARILTCIEYGLFHLSEIIL